MAEVATTKLFENEQIAMWEMVLEPGQSSGLHTHERPYVFSVFEGSTIEITDAQGKSCCSVNMETGSAMHFQFEGQELVCGDIRIPATHEAHNRGNTRFREVLVETKYR